jgi:hypothetical protein
MILELFIFFSSGILAIYSWPKQKGWLEEPRPILFFTFHIGSQIIVSQSPTHKHAK